MQENCIFIIGVRLRNVTKAFIVIKKKKIMHIFYPLPVGLAYRMPNISHSLSCSTHTVFIIGISSDTCTTACHVATIIITCVMPVVSKPCYPYCLPLMLSHVCVLVNRCQRMFNYYILYCLPLFVLYWRRLILN